MERSAPSAAQPSPWHASPWEDHETFRLAAGQLDLGHELMHHPVVDRILLLVEEFLSHHLLLLVEALVSHHLLLLVLGRVREVASLLSEQLRFPHLLLDHERRVVLVANLLLPGVHRFLLFRDADCAAEIAPDLGEQSQLHPDELAEPARWGAWKDRYRKPQLTMIRHDELEPLADLERKQVGHRSADGTVA